MLIIINLACGALNLATLMDARQDWRDYVAAVAVAVCFFAAGMVASYELEKSQ